MTPLWRLFHLALARQKPAAWTGYRCILDITWHRDSNRYIVHSKFLDGVSNRAKNIESRNILDLLSSLHEAYRAFDPLLEWRKVTLTESWDEQTNQWCQRTAWEYGPTSPEIAD
jgi:hypothetical protein